MSNSCRIRVVVSASPNRDLASVVVLQVTASKSPKRAIRYFMDHLQRGDYLQADAIDRRPWEGKEIERLGLDGQTGDLKAFAALVLNADPSKVGDDFEDRLREALKPPPKLDLDTVRVGSKVRVPHRGEGRIVEIEGWMAEVQLDGRAKERVSIEVNDLRSPERTLELTKEERLTPRQRPTAGWDYTFSVPKGVSLVWAAGDTRIEDAFDAAIADTMSEIESYAQTRVRQGSGDNQMDEQRDTGNLVWVGFTHDSARPVQHPDGTVTVDPHLHRHVFVHNLTYDGVEDRWKAMKNRAIYERTAYFEQVFEMRLSRNILELGYQVDRRGKSWDISDVPQEMVARYSLRTKEVEDLAEAKGITSDKEKGELGARSRSAKSLAADIKDVSEHFEERSPSDFRHAAALRLGAYQRQKYLAPGTPLTPEDHEKLVNAAVDYALERALERRSVGYEHNVLADAMLYAGAGRCMPEDIKRGLRSKQALIFGESDETHRRLLTTDEIVEQERTLMSFVRDGRDAHQPLVPQPRIDRALSPEQMAAVTHALSSTDKVMAIRGQAGVGKSFLLRSMVNELHRNNVEPVALAPTVAASRGALREAGIEDANTLAMFLSKSQDGTTLRDKAKGGLIVLDEAGLASTPDMLRLMEQADALDARVLLVGDTRQLASVERGDALRLLEDDGLIPAELKQIRRQTNETYKAVVQEMAQGRAAEGLRKAQEAGFVVQIEAEPDAEGDEIDHIAAQEAARRVAAAYEAGKTNLVIAPTHALGRTVTAAVRAELRAKGHLQEDVAGMTLLRQVDRCAAERRDATHALEEGDLVIMRRDDEARDLHMGEVLHARSNAQGKVHLFREDVYESRVEPGLDPRAFAVFRSEEVPIAVGDQVRAFEPMAGMERGDRGTIESIDRWAHTLTLTDGREISMDSKYLGHGYVVTVQGAQGQSVDHAIVVATSSSLPAMSQEAMYVAASRGREHLDIITDDIESLENAVGRSIERAHGVDVAKEAYVRELAEHGGTANIQNINDDILRVPAPEPAPMTDDRELLPRRGDEVVLPEPAFVVAKGANTDAGCKFKALTPVPANVPITEPLLSSHSDIAETVPFESTYSAEKEPTHFDPELRHATSRGDARPDPAAFEDEYVRRHDAIGLPNESSDNAVLPTMDAEAKVTPEELSDLAKTELERWELEAPPTEEIGASTRATVRVEADTPQTQQVATSTVNTMRVEFETRQTQEVATSTISTIRVESEIRELTASAVSAMPVDAEILPTEEVSASPVTTMQVYAGMPRLADDLDDTERTDLLAAADIPYEEGVVFEDAVSGDSVGYGIDELDAAASSDQANSPSIEDRTPLHEPWTMPEASFNSGTPDDSAQMQHAAISKSMEAPSIEDTCNDDSSMTEKHNDPKLPDVLQVRLDPSSANHPSTIGEFDDAHTSTEVVRDIDSSPDLDSWQHIELEAANHWMLSDDEPLEQDDLELEALELAIDDDFCL